jgi:hypothetical protein
MISPISFISPLVHIPYGHLLYRPWYMWWVAAFTARKTRDREDARLFSSPGGGTASAARKGLPFGLFPVRNKSYKCQIRLVLDLSKPLVSKALQTKCNLVSKNGFHLKIRKWSRLLCFPSTYKHLDLRRITTKYVLYCILNLLPLPNFPSTY